MDAGASMGRHAPFQRALHTTGAIAPSHNEKIDNMPLARLPTHAPKEWGWTMSPSEFCDAHAACDPGREWAVENCRTMDDAWATARPDWLVWIATRLGVLDDRTLRLFAVWCARRVQHLTKDPMSIAALDVAERHSDGRATDEELAAAGAAAGAAAWAAARTTARTTERATERATARAAAGAAARATARAAAGDAARAAAWDSAWAAAGDAARAAAWDAAWDAAWAAQAAWLRANAKPDWERARKMGGAR